MKKCIHVWSFISSLLVFVDCLSSIFLYLNKVAQLRGKDENIGGEWHLTEALELLIIHVHVLHRRVERVEAEK